MADIYAPIHDGVEEFQSGIWVTFFKKVAYDVNIEQRTPLHADKPSWFDYRVDMLEEHNDNGASWDLEMELGPFATLDKAQEAYRRWDEETLNGECIDPWDGDNYTDLLVDTDVASEGEEAQDAC